MTGVLGSRNDTTVSNPCLVGVLLARLGGMTIIASATVLLAAAAALGRRLVPYLAHAGASRRAH